MGQIIKSLASVCLCVCMSSLLRSQFWVDFDETLHSRLEHENQDRVRWGLRSDNGFPYFLFYKFMQIYAVYVHVDNFVLGHLEATRVLFPPFPIPDFTPNFTGYELDQKDIDWYDMFLKAAPNDSLIHVRNTSIYSYLQFFLLTLSCSQWRSQGLKV